MHCTSAGDSRAEQHRRIGAPAHIDVIAPVDRPLGRAPLVLGEYGHDLACGCLDAIDRAVAEIAELPDRALQLIQARAAARLLAQPSLLGPQRDPHALAGIE